VPLAGAVATVVFIVTATAVTIAAAVATATAALVVLFAAVASPLPSPSPPPVLLLRLFQSAASLPLVCKRTLDNIFTVENTSCFYVGGGMYNATSQATMNAQVASNTVRYILCTQFHTPGVCAHYATLCATVCR
jgi:hypothetical protein